MKYGLDPFGQTKLYPSVMQRLPTDKTSGVLSRTIGVMLVPSLFTSSLDLFDASHIPFAVLRTNGLCNVSLGSGVENRLSARSKALPVSINHLLG
eukprot:1256597-Amphidinium_carterae.1